MCERHKERDKRSPKRGNRRAVLAGVSESKNGSNVIFRDIYPFTLSRRTISFEAVSSTMHASLNIYSNVFS